MTDGSQETDLSRLYQQRADIERRIAKLQEEAGTSDGGDLPGLDAVSFVSGYYCRVCRKLLRGDYSAKVAHCREEVHLSNLANNGRMDDSGNQDADSLFKYYEEKYECIAFDGDDDNGTIADPIGNGGDQSTGVRQGSQPVDALLQEPLAGNSASNGVHAEEMDEDAVLFGEPSSCTVGGQASDDEEDGDTEEASHRRRFDRTKISRPS